MASNAKTSLSETIRNSPSQPYASWISYNKMLHIYFYSLPPTLTAETDRGERGHQEVVDDVAGEEESIDEASVLVPEGLRGDGRLGGVGACNASI